MHIARRPTRRKPKTGPRKSLQTLCPNFMGSLREPTRGVPVRQYNSGAARQIVGGTNRLGES
eukprot:11168613-Lingulodinium_polyedra.AAC.1